MKTWWILLLSLLPLSSPSARATQGLDATPGTAGPGTQGSAPVDLVLITADDLGFQYAGCYGNPWVSTPHLDALARTGVCMDRMYTPTALCTPARAAVLSGRHPIASGVDGFVPLRDGVTTLPRTLSAAGYRTAAIGKIHVDPPEAFGFDTVVDPEELAYGRDTEGFGREVRTFLENAKGDPVFLMVNFTDPHRPWPQRSMPEGKAKEVANPHDPSTVVLPPQYPDTLPVRVDLAQYADAIRRMDAGIGRVLAELRRANRLEGTLVVFLSDHGPSLPLAKGTLFEAGVRVPSVWSWPGHLPEGTRCSSLASFVDVMPTLLAGAELPIPEGVEGMDLGPTLRDPTVETRDTVFLTHTHKFKPPANPCRGIVTREWKYIRNFDLEVAYTGAGRGNPTFRGLDAAAVNDPARKALVDRFLGRPQEMLFHLGDDPWELVDLALDPQHHGQLRRMRRELREALESQGDPYAEDDWSLPTLPPSEDDAPH